jgi:hypothetical protein
MNPNPLIFMRTCIRHYQPILLLVIDRTYYHTIPALLAFFGPGDALYEKSGANRDRPPHPPKNG